MVSYQQQQNFLFLSFFLFFPWSLWEMIIEMSFGADEYPGGALAHYFLLDHLPLTLT